MTTRRGFLGALLGLGAAAVGGCALTQTPDPISEGSWAPSVDRMRFMDQKMTLGGHDLTIAEGPSHTHTHTITNPGTQEAATNPYLPYDDALTFADLGGVMVSLEEQDFAAELYPNLLRYDAIRRYARQKALILKRIPQ